MKRLVALFAFLIGFPLATRAETPAAPGAAEPAPSAVVADLNALVDRIQQKLQAGKMKATDFTEELPQFDALLAKYKGTETDDVASILAIEASLYSQVFGDFGAARSAAQRLKAEFPHTAPAAQADAMIASFEQQEKAGRARAALVGKPAPALHFTWSTDGTLKSLADLKGKVVILDFWATWCGPCVASFPNVRELAAHYKSSDVAVVGVTSIQGSISNLKAQPIDTKGDPAKETELLGEFVKAKDMTWTVALSTEEVFNPDYGIKGIPFMAIIAPDGTVRHIGLHPAIPLQEKVDKIDAILKEFRLKLPQA